MRPTGVASPWSVELLPRARNLEIASRATCPSAWGLTRHPMNLWIVDSAGSASGMAVNLPRMTRAFASAASDVLLEHEPLTLAELDRWGR